MTGGPETQPLGPVQAPGQGGEAPVAEGGAEQGHTEGQAVGPEASGHGHRRQVQQVHEVGVGPQATVEADRVGFDLGDGVDGRRRGGQDAVEPHQGLVRPALEGGQPVLGLEGVHRPQPRGRGDDAPGHLQQGLGVRLDEGLDGGIALCHPGALVEQAGGLAEGGEVEGDRLATEPLESGDGGPEQALALHVAEKLQGPWHAEAEGRVRRRGRVPARGPRPGIGVCGIEVGRDGQHRGGVGQVQGKDAHAVQRAAGRHHPGGGDQARGSA